jgi:hypothetical protein
MNCTAPSERTLAPQAPTNNGEVNDIRTALLGLRLQSVGMSVGQAWAALNAHVRDLRDAPPRAQERSKETAEVALALWDAGIEYVVTDDGMDCRHEGWLHVSNPDVGANSYPVIDELDVPMFLALTRMA